MWVKLLGGLKWVHILLISYQFFFIKKAASPSKYGDGNRLYLIVEPSGAKRWEQRLTIQGRRRDIGLGSASIVSLEDARTKAHDNKRIARLGATHLLKSIENKAK